MTVRVFRSSDVGAPTLSNANGTLINVLDACLVNGYGSVSPAGWSRPFAGTNIAVYRQGAGNQRYLQITDTGGNIAYARGWEAMTGVSIGTGGFPMGNDTSMPNGVLWFKSSVATATPWVVIATETTFYIWVNYGNAYVQPFTGARMWFFGDIQSYRTPDNYNTMIIGMPSADLSQCTTGWLSIEIGQTLSGHYIARGYHQEGSVLQVGKTSAPAVINQTSAPGGTGRGYVMYPTFHSGNLMVAPVWIHEPFGNYPIRGLMPGFWSPCAGVGAQQHGDVYPGTVGTITEGKTFEVFTITITSNTTLGQMLIETSDTW